jgi:hypothetical protein
MLGLNTDFVTLDWTAIPEEVHAGESGTAYWRVQQFGDVRVRIVRYTQGYRADHWCRRGHVLHVLEGRLHTALEDGRSVLLERGMTYVVQDNGTAHRSSTDVETTLFIVD